MKELTIQELEVGFNHEAYNQYMLKKSIDEFLNKNLFNELHPITNKIIEYVNLPEIGSHLVTPRLGYTHHGIYVGNKQVIQYSGFSGEKFNTDDIVPVNSYNRSPIEKVSFEAFTQGKEYWIEEHPNTKFTGAEIVERAHQRLGESKYNLAFSNCEHFANWCVYNTDFSKQTKTASKITSKIFPLLGRATDVYHFSKALISYVNGDINEKKLFEEIGENITTTATMFYYGALGQTLIPIPLIGGLIGVTVGYVIGNLLHNSGLFAIVGDAKIVKQSKEKREKIEKISKLMLPIMQENRLRLESFMENYFSDRKEIFYSSVNELEKAIKNNDSETATKNLSKINNLYGKDLTYKSFDDFKNMLNQMNSKA